MVKYYLEIKIQLITNIWYRLLNTDKDEKYFKYNILDICPNLQLWFWLRPKLNKSIANIRHDQILSRDTDTTYNKYMVLSFKYR